MGKVVPIASKILLVRMATYPCCPLLLCLQQRELLCWSEGTRGRGRDPWSLVSMVARGPGRGLKYFSGRSSSSSYMAIVKYYCRVDMYVTLP